MKSLTLSPTHWQCLQMRNHYLPRTSYVKKLMFFSQVQMVEDPMLLKEVIVVKARLETNGEKMSSVCMHLGI